MNHLALGTFEQRFAERIRARRPFSLLRLGDGEATVLRWPHYASFRQAQMRVERWWKDPPVTMSTLRTIRLALLSAFRGADMLGVPSVAEQRQWPKWNTGLRFERLFAWLALPKTGADVFYFYHIIDLDRDGALADALHNTASIRLITCRPRALDAARTRFHARSTEAYLVRAEEFRWKRFADVDAAARDTAHCPPHWMEGYRGALRWIHTGGPGHVYLIGAGGPGKVYCAAAKAAGSIGLDVGALFDGWCGLPTRPYLKAKDKVPCADV